MSILYGLLVLAVLVGSAIATIVRWTSPRVPRRERWDGPPRHAAVTPEPDAHEQHPIP